MRSWRILVDEAEVNEVVVVTDYADLFVVQRDPGADPGPTDWEATLVSRERIHLAPGLYELGLRTPGAPRLVGRAHLRFSDGNRHLFRGDAVLEGLAAALG
ncbi:MAG: hypothetical protein AB7L84_09125 [Acidimicrobiia bacterium]